MTKNVTHSEVQRTPSILRRLWWALRPGRRAWNGALIGNIIAAMVVTGAYGTVFYLGAGPVVDFLAGGVLALTIAVIFFMIYVLLRWIPGRYLLVVGSLFPLLMVIAALSAGFGAPLFALAVLALGTLLGAGVASLGGRRSEPMSGLRTGISVAGLLVGAVGLGFGVAWVAGDGVDDGPFVNAAAVSGTPLARLSDEDPSRAGGYAVRSLTYGSGTDRHRPEYAGEADLLTSSVDGRPFVDNWVSLRAWLRESYWGFGPEAFPLNGRVWYPDGTGPFPLVLIVHGNHAMEDFSDAGYAYLGELLASRGYIVASIDQNFLNISNLRGLDLGKENDARAWLLLEHLRCWHEWNATAGNPFHALVDTERIALIGHSRGGEAAAAAAAFNRIAGYPEDLTVGFDYGFRIRTIIALAPIDGQYEPAGRPTVLENVNYLVLHGANDGDVQSFAGLRQYHRTHFIDEGFWVKAGVYIHRANHGYFNTGWGRHDLPAVLGWFINVKPLLEGEEQRQIARVYISAFLDATLRERREYLPLFKDHRAAGNWLPETIYLSLYEDSSCRMVATYEEDIDAGTTTLTGGEIRAEGLAVWREGLVPMRWKDQNTRAAYLGWESSDKAPRRYVIALPATLPASWRTDDESVLVFSLADANEPLPSQEETGRPADEPIDLTVELVDAAGQSARLPLSCLSALQPALTVQRRKAAIMDLGAPSELVFQTFHFPLAAFLEENPQFDASAIRTIGLVFDRTDAGVVVLNDVGFCRLAE